MSRQAYQGYGTVREYHDDPSDYRDDHQTFTDIGFSSFDEAFSQITSNIFNINNGATVLDKAAKIIGTDRDNGHASEKVHGISQDTGKVVQSTARLIKQLANKKLERPQRLQLDKVRSDFQESVQRFQNLQKKSLERARTASRVEKPKPQPKEATLWLDGDEDDQTQLVADDTRRTQILAQEQVIDDDLALIQEREEQIRELEGDILDINEIFRDLGTMVMEQGEQLDSIEANCEKAHTYVEEGTGQLQKASTYQKKSRKKLCCLLVIGVIVAVVITIIIVVSVK